MKTLEVRNEDMTTLIDEKLPKSKLVSVSVEPDVKEKLEREAASRGRSVSSLIYMILHQSTCGFTIFSSVDIPLVAAKPAVEESKP